MTGNGHSNGNLTLERLATGLGWFSIGLGLAEVIAPKSLARFIGVKRQDALFRAFGLREILSGLGILGTNRRSKWVKSRVAGDALDLAFLGAALSSSKADASKLAMATTAVAGVTALDVLCSLRLKDDERQQQLRDIRVTRTLTINRSPEEVFSMWRNFERFPEFMSHLESVKVMDNKRSHWVAKGPARTKVEWDAEIVEERPNQMIAWGSLPEADVDNSGHVTFTPARGNRGTVVQVELFYRPPAGSLGRMVAKIFGESPEKQMAVDLMRFKQLIETGEIARTEGQPAGRSRSTSRKYDDFVRA